MIFKVNCSYININFAIIIPNDHQLIIKYQQRTIWQHLLSTLPFVWMIPKNE